MKKYIFALLLCAGAASSAFGQSGNPPITITEVDGSPRVTNPTKIVVSNGSLTVSGKTATIVTGGGGGGGTPGGANTQVQYNNAGSFGGVAGFTFNGTSTISLGVAGTSVGAIGFRNATSGTITLQPVTGALGTVTLSLPAVTDTLVGLAATQTLSNKTLASPSLTGNLTGTTTSQIRYGSNVIAYEDSVGPKFTDSNTGAILTFNTQSVVTDRIITWPNLALTVAGIDVANSWSAGVKQTFAPNGTTAGINVGSVAGDPSAPANGDLWYDSTANELTARINGANVALGAGGGSPGGSNTQLQYNNSSAFGGISGVTSDGTNVTAGSGNLRATSPRITTSILDTNGNTLLGITATGSATEYITIANNTATNAVSLTASSPTVAASAQAGTPFNLTASPAIAGNVNVGAAAGGSVTITAGAAARLTSGNANGGNINLVTGAGIGTGTAGQVVIPAIAVTTPSLTFSGFTTSGISYASGFLGLMEGNELGVVVGGAINTVRLPSDYILAFSSNTGNTGAADIAINRLATGVLRVTNASTGSGNLVIGTSSNSIGTSGVGVLAIGNGTVPSSSPADEFQLYSADSAAGDANAFARNEAGEINRLTGLSARNSSSFAKTSDTTLANITGLTRNVEASRAYAFRAVLETTAAATGGVKFAVSGTATATSINYEGILYNGAAVVAQTRATALDTVVCAVTNATAATCVIEGVIVVANAGTLTLQFAQNASDGGASTVLVNQYMQLIPIS